MRANELSNVSHRKQVQLTADDRGGVAITFALLVPLMVGAVGMAVDYGRARQLQARLLLAADAAAIHATKMVGDGASISDATAAAQVNWTANMTGASGTISTPAISITNSSGTVTSKVAFSGSINTGFANILGLSKIPVSGESIATASQSSAASKTFSGTGDAFGDPHFEGADGSSVLFNCPRPSWYNMLSDGGIQLNIACITYPAPASFDLVSDFSVMLGSHTISVSANMPDQKTGLPMGGPGWYNQVKIDGVDYAPGLGVTKLASWKEGTVTATINTTNFWAAGDVANGVAPTFVGPAANKIVVTTPQYTISMGYNGGGWMKFDATNAGVCGVPGGLFGNTLGGIDNFNMDDYKVPTATSTSPEFDRTPCQVVSASKVRLIK